MTWSVALLESPTSLLVMRAGNVLAFVQFFALIVQVLDEAHDVFAFGALVSHCCLLLVVLAKTTVLGPSWDSGCC